VEIAMALQSCKSCKQQVSTSAVWCPACGHFYGAVSWRIGWTVVVCWLSLWMFLAPFRLTYHVLTEMDRERQAAAERFR
jgi:hypothetical protein